MRSINVIYADDKIVVIPTPNLAAPLPTLRDKDLQLLQKLFYQLTWKQVHDEYIGFNPRHGLALRGTVEYCHEQRVIKVVAITSRRTPASVLTGAFDAFKAEMADFTRWSWGRGRHPKITANPQECKDALASVNEDHYLGAWTDYHATYVDDAATYADADADAEYAAIAAPSLTLLMGGQTE